MIADICRQGEWVSKILNICGHPKWINLYLNMNLPAKKQDSSANFGLIAEHLAAPNSTIRVIKVMIRGPP